MLNKYFLLLPRFNTSLSLTLYFELLNHKVANSALSVTFILVWLSQGFSISKAWAMVEDNGITYCTLYNLIEGETFDTVLYVVMKYSLRESIESVLCIHRQRAGGCCGL